MSPARTPASPEAPKLVDRFDERRELAALLERKRPSLVLLTGRRRVGKTFLLANAWPEELVFLFTAARTTGELNRQQLVQDLATWSAKARTHEDYQTWRTHFR